MEPEVSRDEQYRQLCIVLIRRLESIYKFSLKMPKGDIGGVRHCELDGMKSAVVDGKCEFYDIDRK